MTQQLTIGDLVTNEIIRPQFLKQQRAKLEGGSEKKRAENAFDADCVRFRLPRYIRQFELVKVDQSERKRAKPLAWHFDFYFVDYQLIVEIDGGIWSKGAHGHPVDIVRNMHKRNDAARAGLFVISFTTKEALALKRPAIDYTMRLLNDRGWKP